MDTNKVLDLLMELNKDMVFEIPPRKIKIDDEEYIIPNGCFKTYPNLNKSNKNIKEV